VMRRGIVGLSCETTLTIGNRLAQASGIASMASSWKLHTLFLCFSFSSIYEPSDKVKRNRSQITHHDVISTLIG
jgi:hypothetical protein